MARFVSGTLPRGLRSWRCKDKRTAFCHQSFLRTGRRIVSGSYDETVCVCAYRMGRVGKVLSGWKSQPLYETLSWDPGTGCQLHLTEQPDHCSLDITHDGWIGDSTTNRTLSKLPTMVSAANVKVLGLIYVVHERSLAVGMKDGRVFILLSAQSVNEHRHAWYRGRNI